MSKWSNTSFSSIFIAPEIDFSIFCATFSSGLFPFVVDYFVVIIINHRNCPFFKPCSLKCAQFSGHYRHRHWPEYYAFELREMQRFSDVLYFVREQADASTTAAELASLMHLPESAFFREFRTVFNISPKQFLQQEIFNKAAQLLLMPEMSVKLTAARLNFSSEFYFSHFFKRLSGVLPKKYRETHLFSAQ